MYVTTEPLRAVLTDRIDTSVMGRGGFRSGAIDIAERVAQHTGRPWRSELRFIQRTLLRSNPLVTAGRAVRFCRALGLNPFDIWSPREHYALSVEMERCKQAARARR